MSFAKDKLKNKKLNKITKEFFLIIDNYTLKKISPNNVGGDYKILLLTLFSKSLPN